MAKSQAWYVTEAAISTPAGTTITSPQQTTVVSQWCYLNEIRYRFPPGPMGCLGFYVANGGTQIIPFPPSQPWIIDDDKEATLLYGGEVAGNLVIYTANYGNYQHELLLTITWYPIAAYNAGTVVKSPGVTLLASESLNPNAVPASDFGSFTVAEGN